MIRSKWGSVLLCVWSVACSEAGRTGEEAVQHGSQAIYRGTSDNGPVSNPWRNAIVALGSTPNCTGFYVTSTLIVTANHCVNGDADGPGAIGVGSKVWIGRDGQNLETSRTVTSIQTIINGKTLDNNAQFDIALLEATPPVVAEVYAQKPRLITPPLDGSIGHFPLFFAGWGLTENGAPRFRQLQFSHPDVHRVAGPDHGWFMNFGNDEGSYNGTFFGDSGGPLLWQYDPNDDTKWDIIGAVHGGNFGVECDGSFLGLGCDKIYADWVDLTWTSPGILYPDFPSDEGIGRWLKQAATHFAPNYETARWAGETDYVGPCRPDVDPDCDRYISKASGGSDSCPTVFDPEQLPGGDLDNDGVSDWCDNCPADANPKQENSDGDAFGDACDLCAGKQDFSDCSGGCVGPGNRCITFTDPNKSDCFDPLLNNVTCNEVSRCARLADTDGDAVGDQCDNCLTTKNTDQGNCNEDAERSRNLSVLGDACDPVPCSRSVTQEVSYNRSFTSSACGPLSGSCPVVVSADIGWQGVNNNASAISGTTTFAHCNCSAPHDSVDDRRLNCNTDAFGHSLCPLGRASAFPVASGAILSSGWHAITTTAPKEMTSGTSSTSPRKVDLSTFLPALLAPTAPAGVLDAAHPTSYAQVAPTGRTRWLFDRDITRFGVNFTVPAGGVASVSALLPLATALEGVGWAFTTSYNGPSFSGDLRSNYFAQDLNPQSRYLFPLPRLPIAVLPPWIRPEPGICAGCSSIRYPWFARDPTLDPRAVIGIGIDTVQVIRPNFDSGLLDLLGRVGSGVALHVPSESDGLIERLGATERGALLNADTHQITAIRAGQNGSLVSQLLSSTLAVLPDAAAFSAARGELYAFNQTEAGEQLTVVDTRSSNTLQFILGSVGRGLPVSATYRYSDDSIYLLDRTSASSGPLRLLRVSRAGQALDLGQIPNTGFRTTFYLATTSDDRLLISAAGQPWDQPVYLELTTTTSAAQLVSVRYGDRPGAFLAPPRVNRTSGYATALLPGSGSSQTFGEEHRADFTPVAVPLAGAVGLLQARSGLDNCTTATLAPSSNCAPLRSLAVYAARQLKIDDHATVRSSSGSFAPIASGGTSTTIIGPDAQLGSVLSVAPVDLRDRALVSGFVKSAAGITRGNQVSVSGAITPQSSLLSIPLVSFAAQFPANTANSVSLEPDQTVTLSPGAYADAIVKPRAKLRLSSGVYVFHSLDIEAGGSLGLDTSAGPIFVYVETTLIYRGATTTEHGPSADFLVAVFGSGLLAIESSFTGTLVAPNASINLGTVSAGHTGSFFGLDVEVSPQTKVTLAPFNYPWTP